MTMHGQMFPFEIANDFHLFESNMVTRKNAKSVIAQKYPNFNIIELMQYGFGLCGAYSLIIETNCTSCTIKYLKLIENSLQSEGGRSQEDLKPQRNAMMKFIAIVFELKNSQASPLDL